jgi:hypothetical protein
MGLLSRDVDEAFGPFIYKYIHLIEV